jgi:hypothetical protein
LVVTERDIEHPMQAVLDGPVAAHGLGQREGPRGLRKTRNSASLARVLDHEKMVERRPKTRLFRRKQNGQAHGGGSESRATQPNSDFLQAGNRR